jgi:hypothetical protein
MDSSEADTGMFDLPEQMMGLKGIATRTFFSSLAEHEIDREMAALGAEFPLGYTRLLAIRAREPDIPVDVIQAGLCCYGTPCPLDLSHTARWFSSRTVSPAALLLLPMCEIHSGLDFLATSELSRLDLLPLFRLTHRCNLCFTNTSAYPMLLS